MCRSVLQHIAVRCSCCDVNASCRFYHRDMFHMLAHKPQLVVCSVLQCVAVCCSSVLQCAAVCCSMLQYVAVCCSESGLTCTHTHPRKSMQRTRNWRRHCNALQHTCNTLATHLQHTCNTLATHLQHADNLVTLQHTDTPHTHTSQQVDAAHCNTLQHNCNTFATHLQHTATH